MDDGGCGALVRTDRFALKEEKGQNDDTECVEFHPSKGVRIRRRIMVLMIHYEQLLIRLRGERRYQLEKESPMNANELALLAI